MTDTTQVRPRFGRFDDHDENSEDGRPTYGDEGIVFDADDAALDEDRHSGASARRRVDAALTGAALAVVAFLGGGPGRWETIRYVMSARLRPG